MFNCGLANMRAIIYAVAGKKKKNRERDWQSLKLSFNPLI
jgi:hypothetical protein